MLSVTALVHTLQDLQEIMSKEPLGVLQVCKVVAPKNSALSSYLRDLDWVLENSHVNHDRKRLACNTWIMVAKYPGKVNITS